MDFWFVEYFLYLHEYIFHESYYFYDSKVLEYNLNQFHFQENDIESHSYVLSAAY